MTTRIAQLEGALHSARTALRQVVAGHPPEALRRPPAGGGWSAAQTVEHLHLVEHGIARALGRLLDGADLAALGPETDQSSVLHLLDHVRIEERDRRIAAPPTVTPPDDVDPAAALAALDAARERLLAVLARADGWAVGSLTWPHPLLGALNFYQWMLFIAQHERRHTRQVADALA